MATDDIPPPNEWDDTPGTVTGRRPLPRPWTGMGSDASTSSGPGGTDPGANAPGGGNGSATRGSVAGRASSGVGAGGGGAASAAKTGSGDAAAPSPDLAERLDGILTQTRRYPTSALEPYLQELAAGPATPRWLARLGLGALSFGYAAPWLRAAAALAGGFGWAGLVSLHAESLVRAGASSWTIVAAASVSAGILVILALVLRLIVRLRPVAAELVALLAPAGLAALLLLTGLIPAAPVPLLVLVSGFAAVESLANLHRHRRFAARQLLGEPIALESASILAAVAGVPVVAGLFLLDWPEARLAEARTTLGRLAPGSGNALAQLGDLADALRDGVSTRDWLDESERHRVSDTAKAEIERALPPAPAEIVEALVDPVPAAGPPLGFPADARLEHERPLPKRVLHSWSADCPSASPTCTPVKDLLRVAKERAALLDAVNALNRWEGRPPEAPYAPLGQAFCQPNPFALLDASTWAHAAACGLTRSSLANRVAGAWFSSDIAGPVGPLSRSLYDDTLRISPRTCYSARMQPVLCAGRWFLEPVVDGGDQLIGAVARAAVRLVPIRAPGSDAFTDVPKNEKWMQGVPAAALARWVIYLYFADDEDQQGFVALMRGGATHTMAGQNFEDRLGARRGSLANVGLHLVGIGDDVYLVWTESPGELMLTVLRRP